MLSSRFRKTSSPVLCLAMVTTRSGALRPRSLRGQPVEKLDQFIFQMRNRIVRRCTIQIVYMPVFDTFTPLGESGGDERAMLGLFHSYNMICRRQVGLRQGNWK